MITQSIDTQVKSARCVPDKLQGDSPPDISECAPVVRAELFVWWHNRTCAPSARVELVTVAPLKPILEWFTLRMNDAGDWEIRDKEAGQILLNLKHTKSSSVEVRRMSPRPYGVADPFKNICHPNYSSMESALSTVVRHLTSINVSCLSA